MNVRDAVVRHIRHRQAMMDHARGVELQEHGPRLPVSQLGHCPRRCVFEAVHHHPEHPLHAEVTHPYDEYVQEIMECGNVWERETSIALQQAYGSLLHWEKGDPALRAGNEHWLGHIDFFVRECQQFPYGAVIEHKATNPDNFVKKGRLPYPLRCSVDTLSTLGHNTNTLNGLPLLYEEVKNDEVRCSRMPWRDGKAPDRPYVCTPWKTCGSRRPAGPGLPSVWIYGIGPACVGHPVCA